MGLSRTVSEINGDFCWKSLIFATPGPVYLTPSPMWLSLELGVGAGGSKTRMMGLLGRIRILAISSAVWIQCTNVTDRRRDGQTPGDSKHRLHIASRSKKCKCPLFRTSLSVVFSFFKFTQFMSLWQLQLVQIMVRILRPLSISSSVIARQHSYACRARYCYTSSVSLSVCLSVCLSICLSVCLSVQCRYCATTNRHIVTLFDALIAASL